MQFLCGQHAGGVSRSTVWSIRPVILGQSGGEYEQTQDRRSRGSIVSGDGRLVGRRGANDLQKLPLRRRNAVRRWIFPARFARPFAARWQGGDPDQAPGAVGVELFRKRGYAEDDESRPYHAQARQTAGNGMRADMKKGRNDFVPTLCYFTDRA